MDVSLRCAHRTAAVPASVALLPGMAPDVRTPDKLVDGHNRWAGSGLPLPY